MNRVEPDVEVGAFLQQRTIFFAEVGKCIIEYQKIEDHLENLFVASLGGLPEKAVAVFALLKGLEPKLAAVTAALGDADGPLLARWIELKKRVSQAAEIRNQIAHSRPVSTSDPITIKINGTGEASEVSGGGNSRTEI